MHRYEYRVERIPMNREAPRLLGVVERLTELGRQGWHVASADLARHREHELEPLTVLLERELEGGSLRRRGGHRSAGPPDQ